MAQVFSCEFCEISKNRFFTKHLCATSSFYRNTSCDCFYISVSNFQSMKSPVEVNSPLSKIFCHLQRRIWITGKYKSEAMYTLLDSASITIQQEKILVSLTVIVVFQFQLWGHDRLLHEIAINFSKIFPGYFSFVAQLFFLRKIVSPTKIIKIDFNFLCC